MTPAPLHLFLLSGVLPVGPVESVRVVHQDSAAQDVVAERREEIHEISVVQHPFDVGVWEVGAPRSGPPRSARGRTGPRRGTVCPRRNCLPFIWPSPPPQNLA